MRERRCPHGFLRSQVRCPECGDFAPPSCREPGRPSRHERAALEGKTVKPTRRVIARTWAPKRLAPLAFPMSCRFCRRGCHHENHANTCAARIEHRRREARREWLGEHVLTRVA